MNTTTLGEIAKSEACDQKMKIKPLTIAFASSDLKTTNEMQILPLALKSTGKKFAGGWEEHTLTLLMGSPLKEATWILRIKPDGSAKFLDLKKGSGQPVAIEGIRDIGRKEAFRFEPTRICNHVRPAKSERDKTEAEGQGIEEHP